MLENNKIHVNTDLRQRFVPRRTIHIGVQENRMDAVWKAEKISKGDYIVLIDNGIMFFGQVLNFKRLTKKNSIYYRDVVTTNSSENIGLLLNPIYSIQGGRKKVMSIVKYFKLKFYKCHAKVDVDFTEENVINFIRYI